MKYKKLGKTDIDVSLICLGTMTWGEQNTQAEAHEQLDLAFERGVNFIDTAEMYPVPPNANSQGKTEEIIGKWQKLKTDREKIVLATKVTPPSDLSYIRNNELKLNKKNITTALEQSLKRLNTDYVDLYQIHWPEREVNYFGSANYVCPKEDTSTPIEETLQALQDLQKEGKIKHIGVSNESAWGVMKFLEISKNKNLPRIASIQNPYNLLNRYFEHNLAEVAYQEDVGLLAYSPLAFGVLSGKYLDGQKPPGARLTLWERFDRYTSQTCEAATRSYVEIAKHYSLDPAQLALAFINNQPFVTSNIIGATNIEQLEKNIDSINIELSDEIHDQIEEVFKAFPNPAP